MLRQKIYIYGPNERADQSSINKSKDEEIISLSDAEFKPLVIRILKELIGHFNNIKKTKAEMKVILSEIKKNLQATNTRGDETEYQINNLEYKE